MLMPLLAILIGVGLLIWSADRFVEGSASIARIFGMPPLLIGMVIVGFGTSSPELVVSTIAATGGNPGIAIGNAYGSNIANIALILGLTSLIRPLSVHSTVLRKEIPILTGITLLSVFLVADFQISRLDGVVLLLVFALLMGWTIFEGTKTKGDPLADEIRTETNDKAMPLGRSIFWLLVGLLLLIASSRVLVWGAVEIATSLGVSDLVIGLTVVAVGTSLPELASAIIAARKGEHDIALGNVLGSNLFNTLAVVGLAATISPVQVEQATLYRDMSMMGLLTISLFFIGYGFKGRSGRINRYEGTFLLLAYIGYTAAVLFPVIRA